MQKLFFVYPYSKYECRRFSVFIFEKLKKKMFLIRVSFCLFNLQRRLQKELMSLIKEPPPGVVVDAESISQNLTQ